MALKEQDIVLYSTDGDGNKIIQMPITRVENVEGAIKTINGVAPDSSGDVDLSGGSILQVSGETIAINAVPTDGTEYIYTMPNDGLVELSCRCGVGQSYHFEPGGDTGDGNDESWYENEGNTIMSVKVGNTFVYPSTTVIEDSQNYNGIFFAKKGQNIAVLCDRTTTVPSYINSAIKHSLQLVITPH